MYEINKTVEFEVWLSAIRDPLTRGRLLARLRKLALGNFGAGWRMYYILRRRVVVIVLGGGIKSTQAADIKKVKKILLTMED